MANINSSVDCDIDVSADEWFESASDTEKQDMIELLRVPNNIEYLTELNIIKDSIEKIWVNGGYIDQYLLKEIEYIINKLKGE